MSIKTFKILKDWTKWFMVIVEVIYLKKNVFKKFIWFFWGGGDLDIASVDDCKFWITDMSTYFHIEWMNYVRMIETTVDMNEWIWFKFLTHFTAINVLYEEFGKMVLQYFLS